MHLKLVSQVKLMQDITLLVPRWRVNKSIPPVYLQLNPYGQNLILSLNSTHPQVQTEDYTVLI